MDKFVGKIRSLILNQAKNEAMRRGLDPQNIEEFKIINNNNPIEAKQNRKHFIFTEYVSCCGFSEKITVIVYITP